MSLTDAKLRAVVNMLSDPGSAANAARVLAEEAKRRGKLISDLVAESLAPTQASAPPPPKFSDVDDDDRIDAAIGKRINSCTFGLRTEILAETGKAWCVRMPAGEEAWLPKSQCQHHGEDAVGRAIFVIPIWLARRRKLL